MTSPTLEELLAQKIEREAEKHRPNVPIDPEAPLISRFANACHLETRNGYKAGANSLKPMILELVEALKTGWPGEYGQTVMRFNEEALQKLRKELRDEKR